MKEFVGDIENRINFVLQSAFKHIKMQQEEIKHIEALNDIRQMMRRSSRFLSLSGFSGIFAGIYALGGYYCAAWYIRNVMGSLHRSYGSGEPGTGILEDYLFFILDAAAVLTLSLLTAYFFSARKARKNNAKLFDHTAWRLFWQMAVPLTAGGLLSIALLTYGLFAFIAPVMLCFYGAALFSASKLTYDDVKYLGLAQLTLGIISAFDLGHGLYYWAIGFGILHIIYGTVMWWKYERDGSSELGVRRNS